ncbi:MAG TPA: MDR family MFS transporter [Nitrolancea sp.]|nr:MDR family MFS transporter [Nitrolancea sp.]
MARVEYKWIVAMVFVFGLFMELLDMTITNVALPDLATSFHANTTGIEWIVTGYLLSLAVFIPLSGWVGDRFGTKRTFMFALVTFTTASLLCSLSWSIGSLIAFRVLQGIGGGMLTPVGTTMMFRAFPLNERARVSALITIPTIVAPASGPVLGGYLVEYHSWHAIFLINVPIGLVALFFSARYLKEHREPSAGRLDIPGFVFGAAGLASLVYALSEAGTRGFGNIVVGGFGALGLALTGAFVAAELRASRPMIDVRLFRYRLFTAGNLVLFFSSAAFGGLIFLLPLLLQAERGLSPLQSGLTTFPQAIGVLLTATLAGRLYSSVGPRKLMIVGMAISAVATLAFIGIDANTNDWAIRMLMLIRGGAFGLALVPLQAATFAEVTGAETGQASAAFSVIRQVASSFGVALVATVLTARLAFHDAIMGNPATRSGAFLAFHDTFVVTTLISGVAIGAAFMVSDKLAAATMHSSAPTTQRTLFEEEEIELAAD